MDEGKLYLPRFESVTDNLGHSWTYGINRSSYVLTDKILRPGDILQFTADAYNPLGEHLYYNFKIGLSGDKCWQSESHKVIEITEEHIKRSLAVYIELKSKRNDVDELYDNTVEFRYTVLAA